jgi:MFS family permease
MYVNAVAAWAFLTFQGLWAIERLGASAGAVGIALGIEAFLGAVMGYLGGILSDRLGRKPVFLVAVATQATATAMLTFLEPGVVAGLVLLVLAGTMAAPAYGVLQPLVTDMVAADRHDAGFAAMRVANNLGLCTGPPLAGLLLIGDDWQLLFGVVSGLLGVTFLLAYRLLPSHPPHAPEPQAWNRRAWTAVLADRPFLLFLACVVLAAIAFVASEAILPIAAVSVYGLSPLEFGLLFSLNPISVVLFQIRFSARVEAVPAGRKIVLAMLLMGPPLLLLTVNHSLPMLVAVILIFVVGEMLWIPTSQVVVAAMAPPQLRGAYLGTAASMWSIAFALGPLIALQLLGRSGDMAMWAFLAGCALAAAPLGVAALRLSVRLRGEAATSPAT